MKRLLLLGVGSALMFTMGGVGPARADNGPHISGALSAGTAAQVVGTDRCASCHRLHTAKSNDGFLLKTTTQEGLCFSCHGAGVTGASTDVVDGIGYEPTPATQDRDRQSGAAALRGGGFSYALINSAGANKILTDNVVPGGRIVTSAQTIPVLAPTNKQATTSNHSVDTAGVTIWGNGPIDATANPGKTVDGSNPVMLECGSCHDPHGNKNFRILKPIPDGANNIVTPAVPAGPGGVPAAVPAVMSIALGVNIPDATSKVYTTTNYWLTGDASVPKLTNGVPIVGTVPDGFIGNISDWCTTCHTRYLAPSGSRSTASGDAVFTYRHTSNDVSKVGGKNCITCHVAHGSNASATGTNSSTVAMPDGTIVANDSKLLRVDNRGICLMCHNV